MMLTLRGASPWFESWSTDHLIGSALSTNTVSSCPMPAIDRVNVVEPVARVRRQRADAVEQLQHGRLDRRRIVFDGRHCAGVPPFPALRAVVWLAARIGAIELVSERPAIAVESRARDAEEQCALGLAHQVAS